MNKIGYQKVEIPRSFFARQMFAALRNATPIPVLTSDILMFHNNVCDVAILSRFGVCSKTWTNGSAVFVRFANPYQACHARDMLNSDMTPVTSVAFEFDDPDPRFRFRIGQ
jgi:hypothetical protein